MNKLKKYSSFEELKNQKSADAVSKEKEVVAFIDLLKANSNMKIVAIGDIHGNPLWKKIVTQENPDLTIFIGDYFDSKGVFTAPQQKNNFRDIIAFKKANPKKVILLIGNHDFHYLSTSDRRYTGYQPFQKADIGELLHSAIDNNLIQICFAYKKYLFVHAGITKTWMKNQFGRSAYGDIVKSVNELFKYKPNRFEFTSGANHSDTGDDICQTPIWVRPASLRKDMIDGYIQVVGHTRQKKHIVIEEKLILIDTLNTSGEYLILTDGTIQKAKL